ncbi:MAG: NAD-dependent epimerase/dehydratase family protein [Phycisphaeraceae bacterium]|nr:NAD-dependent epimerase/dehydratase family protein [Phycisphaeraceae bacterium]
MDGKDAKLGREALIVGCGYLGRRLATRLLALGQPVWGTTRSPRRAEALAAVGIRPLFLSVTELITTASLHAANKVDGLDVYYMVPPGRPGGTPTPRDVVLDGLANVLATLHGGSVRRAVMVSSTGVYPQTDGRRVDADTPIDLEQVTDPRVRLLLEGERLWQRAALPGSIVRLAGLYGPNRVIGLQQVREGHPLAGDPTALLNLIRVEDAVELLIACMGMGDRIEDGDQAQRIELGVDDAPTPRQEYYHYLAELGGYPPPHLIDEREATELGVDLSRFRRTGSKFCDNGPTCRRTGWRPRYPTFREGLADLVNPRKPVTGA